MPFAEIASKPSLDNLITVPLALSAKYMRYPYDAKLSGFLDIPNSPTKGIAWPRTAALEVTFALPSALNNASF